MVAVLRRNSGGKPPQSRRFATEEAALQSRERLDCGASAPLFLLSTHFACGNFKIVTRLHHSEPSPPVTFKLPTTRLVDLKSQVPPKEWPHAPAHRLADNAVYFVTASTLHKQHFFDTPEKRDLLERHLLAFAKQNGWQLETWAVFANHYHIVARGNPDSQNLGEFLHDLHGVTARELNKLDRVQGRQVWFNFRDTRLTIQHSYLARLNYVHQNAVKHRLVAVANQYPWCSAAWFERAVSQAQVKVVYGFKIDRVKVEDDF